MIADAIERRHLVTDCFAKMKKDPQFIRDLNKICGEPKKVALFLATCYINWVDLKRESTTDDVFRMVLNYVTMMTKFKNMVMAVRSGDSSIMIESMYIEMLPVFEIALKKNYIEISCSMV